MAVGLPDSLDSLLDSAPPVHEVCEHVRVTNWYQLGIQLLLDGVELEEIRKDADKRVRMYQLWLRTQPDATRRQLLTALRSKDVGENAVADKYQQLLSQKIATDTSQQTHERSKVERRPSNPVISTDIDAQQQLPPLAHEDILTDLLRRINQVDELEKIACTLQKTFHMLTNEVKDSVIKNVNLDKVKTFVDQELKLSIRIQGGSRVEVYRHELRRIDDVNKYFFFLYEHDFFGYLNYILLKRIGELIKDDNIISKFDEYEKLYVQLISKATFKDLMSVFRQDPSLKPAAPIGLPYVVFRLDDFWLQKGFLDSITTIFLGYSWFESCLLRELKKNGVVLKYAVLPSVVHDVLESLKSPDVQQRFQDLGVRIELPELIVDAIEGHNKVVDILHKRIEQVPELANIAFSLKKEFRSLLMNVQDSVKECHLSKVISLIRLHVVECLVPISESIELYKQKLSFIHTVHEVFAFLIDNHFVGYLNYVLLKEISELEDNLEVNKQFDQYERIYENLLNASTFNLLMQVFKNYPDLSPTTAVGFPEMMFQLKSPWPERSMSNWNEYMNDKFPNWARSLAPKEFSSECLIVKYAVLPSALPAVQKDLKDPVASKELENIGAVTLVHLPDDDIGPRKDEKSTGKIIRVIHKWTPSILWSSTRNVRTTLKSMLQVALSNQHELKMLVTGKTGQGKSTLINGIIGKQIAIEGAGTTRSTEKVMKYTCNICDVPVTVFDSPGLQDRSVNEKEYIESLTNQCKDLSLVLYCTKMINHRITDDDENAMKKLTKAFGEKFWNYAVLVLTFANMESCDRKDSRDENVVEPDLDDEKGWELLEKQRFEHRLKKWEMELKTFLTCEVGVSQKIVERIPVIPTGDYKITRRNRNPMHLPDRDSWFNSFWEACCLRVKETKLFLQINQDRMIVAEDSSDTHRETPEDHCEIVRLSKSPHSLQSKLETEEKEHLHVSSTVYQPQLVREKDTTKDISTQCKESSQSPNNNHPATSDIPITDKFATEVTRHIIERWFGESFGNFIKAALDIIGKPAEWFIGLFKRT